MKYIRMSNNQIYNTLFDCGYDITFTDNKWFINGIEFSFNKIRRVIYLRLLMVFHNIDEAGKWLEWFKENNK